MTYTMQYPSPVGMLTLASDGEAVTGLWIAGQKYFAAKLPEDAICHAELPVFTQAAAWLDAYFGENPLPPLPPLRPEGTAFRKAVWKALLDVPMGVTMTYGELAEQLQFSGIYTSPRAVGGAVGHNPIALLIPCHRILGADGSLTGYAGGVEVKRFLLELESHE